MNVTVVDFGMGNLGSVVRSFEECGASVVVAHSPDALETAERIVLPGVGAFCDGMSRLKSGGWVDSLRRAALERCLPFLGICLGMQLLANRGTEGGDSEGLCILPGEVVRFKPTDEHERVPHVGWNEVVSMSRAAILEGIADRSDFYFVHSYHFIPKDAAHIAAITPYAGTFVSAIASGRVAGVQFHPEKSSKPGLALIKNFIKTGGNAC